MTSNRCVIVECSEFCRLCKMAWLYCL